MAKTQKNPVIQDSAKTLMQVAPTKQGRKDYITATTAQVNTKQINNAAEIIAPDVAASDKKLSSPHTPAPHSKQGILISLLERASGTTIEEMMEATGWQRHSVYGVMSGVLKKRLGFTITTTLEKRGRVYRIAGQR